MQKFIYPFSHTYLYIFFLIIFLFFFFCKKMLYSIFIFTNLVSKENVEIFFALSIRRFTDSFAFYFKVWSILQKRHFSRGCERAHHRCVVVSDGDEKSHGKRSYKNEKLVSHGT